MRPSPLPIRRLNAGVGAWRSAGRPAPRPLRLRQVAGASLPPTRSAESVESVRGRQRRRRSSVAPPSASPPDRPARRSARTRTRTTRTQTTWIRTTRTRTRAPPPWRTQARVRPRWTARPAGGAPTVLPAWARASSHTRPRPRPRPRARARARARAWRGAPRPFARRATAPLRAQPPLATTTVPSKNPGSSHAAAIVAAVPAPAVSRNVVRQRPCRPRRAREKRLPARAPHLAAPDQRAELRRGDGAPRERSFRAPAAARRKPRRSQTSAGPSAPATRQTTRVRPGLIGWQRLQIPEVVVSLETTWLLIARISPWHVHRAWRDEPLGKHRHSDHADLARGACAGSVGIGDAGETKRRHLGARQPPAVDVHRSPRLHQVPALDADVGRLAIDGVAAVDRGHGLDSPARVIDDPQRIPRTQLSEHVGLTRTIERRHRRAVDENLYLVPGS